jgi:hypothetical protein
MKSKDLRRELQFGSPLQRVLLVTLALRSS